MLFFLLNWISSNVFRFPRQIHLCWINKSCSVNGSCMMNEWTNERTNEWMNEWMNECIQDALLCQNNIKWQIINDKLDKSVQREGWITHCESRLQTMHDDSPWCMDSWTNLVEPSRFLQFVLKPLDSPINHMPLMDCPFSLHCSRDQSIHPEATSFPSTIHLFLRTSSETIFPSLVLLRELKKKII